MCDSSVGQSMTGHGGRRRLQQSVLAKARWVGEPLVPMAVFRASLVWLTAPCMRYWCSVLLLRFVFAAAFAGLVWVVLETTPVMDFFAGKSSKVVILQG